MNTMFSARGMNSSSAKERIWRSLTPFCTLKGKDSSVQSSGKQARVIRASRACSWRACHSARSSCVNRVGMGVAWASAAVSISSKRAATVRSFKLASRCWSSSVIRLLRVARREREHEVIRGDLPQHHLLESVQIVEPIALGAGQGGEESPARILLQHGQEPAQRGAPIPDLMLQAGQIVGYARLDLQHLELLGSHLRSVSVSLSARWTMRRVGHTRIERAVHARVVGHTARAGVQIDSIQRLAYLQGSCDEAVGGRVADAVHVHVAFGIHDAGEELIDLWHEQRQRLQVPLFDGEELAAAGVQLVGELGVPGLRGLSGPLVELAPVGKILPGQKGLLDTMERGFHTRGAVGVTERMRLEGKAVAGGKGAHLWGHDHVGPRAGGHDHVGVVHHAGGGRAVKVADRLGQERLALKTREACVVLEVDHARVAQHNGCGLYAGEHPADTGAVGTGVVLQLLTGGELVVPGGGRRDMTDAVTTSEGAQRRIGQGGPAGDEFLVHAAQMSLEALAP